jgi:hypothetical protein
MNTHSTDDTQRQAAALGHYHAHYNNDTYQAVQIALTADLYGESFAHDTTIRERLLGEERPNILLNLLTDVALEICGSPTAQGKQHLLIDLIAHHRIEAKTVRLMSQHLENFEADGSTFSADFENSALTLLNLFKVRDTIQNASSLSSAIHGNHGRAAHHLLRASATFLYVAELLLKAENSKSYLDEKLAQGTYSLADALTEMQQIFPE